MKRMGDLEVGVQNESSREILLALLRGERKTVVPQDTWQPMIRLAEQHGVAELLYHQLTRLEETIASARLVELRQKFLLSAARNAFLYHELAHVLEAFHRQDIPVIVLKGAFIAERIYKNLAARPMGDIDLLVLENDLLQVDSLLAELDFRRQFISLERSEEEHALPYHNAQSGLVIEIHWILIDARHGMQVDIPQLWQRAHPASIAQNTVLEMTPEDQILHLCIHTSVHVFEIGLKALCDLDATLRFYQDQIDWNCLAQRAVQWGAERCVYINLRLTNELMHSPVSTDWLNTIQPEGFEERTYIFSKAHLFQSAEQPGSALPDAAGVVRFWSAEGWSRKLHLLLRRIFPPRAEMARMYPAPAGSLRIFLYYPVRFFDLMRRFGRLGVKLIRGDEQTTLRAKRQNEVNALREWMITRKH